MNWPEGWLVTRKADQRHGIVRNAWTQEPDGAELVFVEGYDPVSKQATGKFLSPVPGGELAGDYDGKPVHAPDIELKAGRRYQDILPAYASHGGYPLVYLTRSNETLCNVCATREIDDGNDTNGDPVIAVDVYWEGPEDACAHCNATIPSAYGDPDDESPHPDIQEERQ